MTTPNQPETPEQQRDRYRHERNLLADKIKQAGVKTGLYRLNVDLSGPHLLMLMEDMTERMSEVQAELLEKQQRLTDALGQIDQLRNQASAPVPDFKAIEDKRVGELTPEQYADASEQWLRNNSGWFKDSEQIDFLFHRLDQARGLNPESKPWVLADNHRKTEGPDALMDDTSDLWLEMSYRNLQKRLVGAAIDAGLANHSHHAENEGLPHGALLRMTHQLGEMVAKEGAEPQKPVEPFANSMGTRINQDNFSQLATHRYEELTRAISRAGRGLSLINTSYRGQALQQTMTQFVDRIHQSVLDQAPGQRNAGKPDQPDHSDPQTQGRMFRSPANTEIYNLVDDEDPDPAPR